MTSKTKFVKAKVIHHMTPGEMLRTIRILQELSQNDLAKLTGLPQSNISAYERGSRQMGRESALIFAKALKTHPAVLLFPDYNVNKAA